MGTSILNGDCIFVTTTSWLSIYKELIIWHIEVYMVHQEVDSLCIWCMEDGESENHHLCVSGLLGQFGVK
jgi:hypothetical protein